MAVSGATPLAILGLALVLGAACGGRPAVAGYPDRSRCDVGLRIPDMSCGEVCPGKVRAALASVEGVEEVEVDFGARTAHVAAVWPACGRDGYGEMLENLDEAGYRGVIEYAE